MVKNWQSHLGLFSAAANWSPSQSPAAGDNLYIQSGTAVLTNGAFGSASLRSTISLDGSSAATAPTLSLTNATLNNVEISEAPVAPSGVAPTGYYTAKYGNLAIGGMVVNNGGLIEGGRDSRFQGNLHVSLQANATLVNHGTLAAGPFGTLTIGGASGSKLENNGSIIASSGKVTVGAHLTGTGQVSVEPPCSGGSSAVELTAAVDAGQTFQIARGLLQIDQPASFLGQVDIAGPQGFGQVRLEGLNAASWDTKGSLLELFNASGARIDTLRFTTPQDPTQLAVYSLPDAMYGHAVAIMPSLGSLPPTGATVLHEHIA